MKNIILVFALMFTVFLQAQTLRSDNERLNDAYRLAVNTLDINTRRGILAAGGDYGGEWTRDIAINSWFGASLLRPQVAQRSLWSVTINKESIGHQYWDKIIWVIAAYNHYLVTGDKDFLRQAYLCSVTTIKELETTVFDPKYGLFMGPSVFNDGIAAYDEPIFNPQVHSSATVDHLKPFTVKCLSTNCVYYGVYKTLIEMQKQLRMEASLSTPIVEKAEALKSNILKYLYNPERGTFNYLIDQNGGVDHSQEGLGLSFAVVFGVVDKEQALRAIANTVVSDYGITSIYPDYKRFSPQMPGRHNNIIWPMVNGFFSNAAVFVGSYKTYDHELNSLISLALDEDKGNYSFFEIYNPYTGKPDGGYQFGENNPEHHWVSCRLQTWSATAFINMVHSGLLGLRLMPDGILFQPHLPDGIQVAELSGIRYRNISLDITIKGKGSRIKSFRINGKQQANPFVSSSAKGNVAVVVELM